MKSAELLEPLTKCRAGRRLATGPSDRGKRKRQNRRTRNRGPEMEKSSAVGRTVSAPDRTRRRHRLPAPLSTHPELCREGPHKPLVGRWGAGSVIGPCSIHVALARTAPSRPCNSPTPAETKTKHAAMQEAKKHTRRTHPPRFSPADWCCASRNLGLGDEVSGSFGKDGNKALRMNDAPPFPHDVKNKYT